MKVTTNKYGNVVIRWQYGITNGDRDVTKAFLEKKVGKESEILREVSVVRNPKEHNDKLVARKFALGKLIKESFSRDAEDLQDRKTVWETYRKTCK